MTNSSWAISEAKAKNKIREFRASGLAEINLSLDTYHEPYIPVDHVRNAWSATKGAGFGSVVIATHSSNHTSCNLDRVFNIIGEEVPVIDIGDRKAYKELPRSSDGTVYCVSIGALQKIGRASRMIPDEIFNWHNLENLEIGCPFFAQNPALSPRNTLLACCGIEANRNPLLDFGALGTDGSVGDLLDTVGNDLFLSAFSLIGPVGMARALKKMDPESGILDQYTSVCHVCEHVTRDPVIRGKLMAMGDHLAKACVAPRAFL